MLWSILLSRHCLWQLALTTVICTGVHVLFVWGSLSNWNDHYVVGVCLFRWAHPAGYHGMGTSLAEAMPVDAVMTAFFTCLGAMKRIDEVQRGSIAHVPPDALHRGPLALLGAPREQRLPGVERLALVQLPAYSRRPVRDL